ncbi:MAG: phosphate ABC transporter substrate-binding protein PstS [Bdellovibrionales bacterium]|nr:phosphate ABC transporter substrate-binding protein PstS [Bdellovibrionales bacterium]
MKYTLLLLLFIPFAFSADKPSLINGAGATFPYILYSKWFSEYSKVDTTVKINYRSIGSGGGIRQLIKGTLDFGASDVPMKEYEIKKSKKPIVHIPTTLSAVVLTYNLENITQPLHLTSAVIAQIFDGRIKKWNDPQLTALNKNIELPAQDIIVVYRADGSGTTAVFTEYLAKTQEDWKVGYGKSVNWPVGIGGKGNEGVLGLVQKTPGAFAYMGMGYAMNQKLPTAHVKNQAGHFIEPTMSSVQESAKDVGPRQSYIESIVNSKREKAYPISSFSYLLVYKEMEESIGHVIINFIQWALSDGQKFSEPLYYVPLPENVITQAKSAVKNIQLKNASS